MTEVGWDRNGNVPKSWKVRDALCRNVERRQPNIETCSSFHLVIQLWLSILIRVRMDVPARQSFRRVVFVKFGISP
jgi:hypothetical protein